MILWLNGAFGSGKTTVAYDLHRRLPGSCVFDPESFGFCLFDNIPESCRAKDFQDIPLWRETNRKMMEMLERDYSGITIVPMTLVNPAYWQEIIGELRAGGADVKHFILYASPETLRKRLKKRSLGNLAGEQFALDAIDRCVTAFNTVITEGKLETDSMTPDQTAEEIARRLGISLLPPENTAKTYLNRVKTWLRHIRK